ncbi:RNA polymerase sigma factor [Sunxiuqinia rutila]|uniref:RNA polymerase sigma factor n=1 Tax=Sunxiuqinia rutila TaxID=1397841 RepID=UPI003D361E48
MEISPDKLQKLATRIRGGEIKAFDELYELYSQRLYGFAFSMLKNKEDSKEIVQETFLKIWSRRAEIDTSHSLKSFLFTISHNLIIDLFRKRVKETEFQSYLKYYFSLNSSESAIMVEFQELNEEVQRLIAELPEKRQQIYKMSREDGLSHKEIASKLGLSTKTVENQINLTLRHLRAHIDSNSLLVLLFMALFS